jgi:dihydropyrimidinase
VADVGGTRRLITGGLIITAEAELPGDVLIENGVITAIGPELHRSQLGDIEAIDASGCYVIPGAVDPHTHVSMPAGPVTTVDDYRAATAAAAAGGTTTIIDFVIQQPGQRINDALVGWQARLAAERPSIDVGFHFAVVDMSVPYAAEDLAILPQLGLTSFKLFMAYPGSLMVDDATMLEVMGVAARTGALVLVHAENGSIIELLVAEARAADHRAPVWHARTRPPIAEREATHRAVALAQVAGCPLYVVHVSCRDSLEVVSWARKAGARVLAETCPQYLTFTEDDLDRPGFEGAKYVFSPPARSAADQDALWAGLVSGDLDAVTSDHCPFRFADQKALGQDDFSLIPNGVGGVQERVVLLHEFGVRTGRISRSRWVELVATGPARIFGLHPRKGSLSVGADADVVIFDPEREATLGVAQSRSRSDYSVYEHTTVRGAPRHVMLRGETVIADGRLTDRRAGEFIARARFGGELA